MVGKASWVQPDPTVTEEGIGADSWDFRRPGRDAKGDSEEDSHSVCSACATVRGRAQLVVSEMAMRPGQVLCKRLVK